MSFLSCCLFEPVVLFLFSFCSAGFPDVLWVDTVCHICQLHLFFMLLFCPFCFDFTVLDCFFVCQTWLSCYMYLIFCLLSIDMPSCFCWQDASHLPSLCPYVSGTPFELARSSTLVANVFPSRGEVQLDVFKLRVSFWVS